MFGNTTINVLVIILLSLHRKKKHRQNLSMLFSFLFLVMCASDNSNTLLLQVFGSFGDHRAFMFFSLCVLLLGTAAQMHGCNADSNKAVQLFAQTFLVIGHLYITAAAEGQCLIYKLETNL